MSTSSTSNNVVYTFSAIFLLGASSISAYFYKFPEVKNTWSTFLMKLLSKPLAAIWAQTPR